MIFFFRYGEKCVGIIVVVLNNLYCGVGMVYKVFFGGMLNYGKISVYFVENVL